MIITAEVTNGSSTGGVTSHWSYSKDDPWAVHVDFPDQEVDWDFSLELLMDAVTTSGYKVHGEGDVRITVQGTSFFIDIHNENGSASLKFRTEKVTEFLNTVDTQLAELVVSEELESFLEAL